MATWDDFKADIKVSEGVIPHMYLDTVGAVTVGVGNMMASAAEAQKLAFVDRTTVKAASKEEITADFDLVKKQMKGLNATAYKEFTKLNLPTSAIDALLDARIAGFKKELKGKFSKFDTYPLTVQFALTDMAFNLGTEGLVTKFPSFKKAVEAEDWAKAATESDRPQVSATRNATVKDWLTEAEKAKPKPLPKPK